MYSLQKEVDKMQVFDVFFEQMTQLLGQGIPRLLVALVILILGWLAALVLSAVARRVLQRTKLDEQLLQWIGGKEQAKGIEVGRWVGTGLFYLVMLLVLVAFFQILGLTLITEPLNRLLTLVFEYAPRVLGAGLLLLVAWIVARVLKLVVSRVLHIAKIDERLGSKAGLEEEKRLPLTQGVAEAVYWLVFLLFLPAILNALALEGLLVPVQRMLEDLLGFLPNIFAAALILAIGWFVARIVQRIVTNVLAAAGVDRLGERVGLGKVLEQQTPSELLGLVLYVLILIPVLIAALNALGLEAITQPAANMLDLILAALPAIFGAILVLVVSYVVGRVVAGLIGNLLTGAGFNTILVKLGLAREPTEGQQTPSRIVGYLVLVAIMLFASIEALRFLGFESVAALVTRFTDLAVQVVLGLIIFGVGLYLANLVAEVVRTSGAAQAKFLAPASRVAILALTSAMALREMGLANEIINLAFGLLLGAVAVALALAFGLGGREIAARELQDWVESVKSEK